MMTWDALASGCTSIRVEGKEVDILKEIEAESTSGESCAPEQNECWLGSVSQKQR